MPPTPDFETVYGSTVDTITLTLTKNGAAVDLSGVAPGGSVVTRWRDRKTRTTEELAMAVDGTPTTGKVSRDPFTDPWPAAGPGRYDVRAKVTYDNGRVEYFPNKDGYFYYLLRAPL